MDDRAVSKSDPDIIIQQVRAGLAFGGGRLPKDAEILIRRYVAGEITKEEMFCEARKACGLK